MTRASTLATLRHVPHAHPLQFPASQPEWDLGQSVGHLDLCITLRELLMAAVGPEHSVGCDQFVYFDAADPRRCLAPDGFVKLDVPQTQFQTWKTWKGGAPELALEILSPSNTREAITFAEKLERYGSLGVEELIVLDTDAAPGARLRAWDRVEGELVERLVEGELTPCVTLGGAFFLAPAGSSPVALRLSRDAQGHDLIRTVAEGQEHERSEKERERGEKERERSEKERERGEKERERGEKERERGEKEAALAEVARLRAELAAR
jgi:hypothetical protein